MIIARRLLFFWTILNKPDNELIKQVYKAQKLRPVKNDWCQTVAEDMKLLEIDLSDSEISNMKKQTFKTLVSRRVRECAGIYLNKLKEKHSKSKGLKNSGSIQKYLASNQLSTDEKQLLFSLRSYTFSCKANYSFKYGSNLQCELCNEIENQQHLLNCKVKAGDDVKYSDLFGPLEKQVKIIKVLKVIIEKRKNLCINTSSDGSQVHQ